MANTTAIIGTKKLPVVIDQPTTMANATAITTVKILSVLLVIVLSS
jgi:hypothetical protein